MDTSSHNISALFAQLGLPNNSDEIEGFIESHRSLRKTEDLSAADFWNESQASFLREAIAEDSDWAEIVDQLDARLRT